jgi:alpha/beta superfamily hydrolase
MSAKHIEVLRRDGRIIRGIIDAPSPVTADTPVVIVVPPYAKTMRNLVPVALYLTANGFQSWRFDYTNHLGASEGDIADFTISSTIDDVKAMTKAVRDRCGKVPLGVICSSLGARVAFRALRESADVTVLISLVGVVNLHATLVSIMGCDLVSDLLARRPIPPSQEVLGYRVRDGFIRDLVQQNLFSLESAREDLARCPFPIIHIAAENDAWTDLKDVEYAFGAKRESVQHDLYLLPEASHKLENNPTASRDALCQAVKLLAWHLTHRSIETADVRCPSFTQIVAQNREERATEERSDRMTQLTVT